MNRTVVDYRGNRIRIQCADEELPTKLYEALIAPYLSDFEYAWLSGTRSEERAKNYLSYVAGLMLRRPNDHNIISARQLRKIHGIELTLGTTDTTAKNIRPLPVKPRKKQPSETRSSRLSAARDAHPGSEITYCRVDTRNRFSYKGVWFVIPSGVKEYAPKQTANGALYDMDRVVVVDDAGNLYFYDQEMRRIDGVSVACEERAVL